VHEIREAIRIADGVLGDLAERLLKRIVIADAWTWERADDAKVLVEGGQILRDLHAAAITVRGQLTARDPMSATSGGDQAPRERR